MSLNRARLAAILDEGFELHDVLPSTQARAKQAAREGAAHGYAVLAERQAAGRGRLGRAWESASASSVLVTVVVRSGVRAADAPLLCLAAAIGVVEAIEQTRSEPGDRYGIKWPNDVLSPDGRKVAGILAECDPRPDGSLGYALLGIGLNVHDAPGLPTATCLDRVEGGTRDRTAVAGVLVRAVTAWCDVVAIDRSRVLDRWRHDQVTLGRRVQVGDVTGEAVAIEPSGALVVRDGAGREHRISTGDVEMVGRA